MADKQQKVLNKINRINCPGLDAKSLRDMKLKPNDECYTSMQDILNELSYWANLRKFEGKNIICPCDWDIVEGQEIYSIHIVYNNADANIIGNDVKVELGLFDEENNISLIDLKEDEIDDFLRNKLTCNFIRTLTQNARRWGIKSITASGYNPANGKGIPFQKVDYSKYDICITNPPFSLYGEFMKCIVDNIDFICLAPFLNRINPCIGVPLMLNKAYLGYNYYIQMNFYNPIKENEYKTKAVCCDWITSYPEAQEERNNEHKTTGVDYNIYKDEYDIMPNMWMKDNTRPIHVPGNAWPDNYNGWMFGPANVLNNLDTSKYEWYLSEARTFYKKNPEFYPYRDIYVCEEFHKINNKVCFLGILFRKKQEDQTNES